MKGLPFQWLQAGDDEEAHYCAIDGKKAAAACGYGSWKPWHTPLRDLLACEKCEEIAKGDQPVVFLKHDGIGVVVRE